MAKLPGNAGVSVIGDKSLEFYRDPLDFCRQRIEKHRSRVFQCRLLNRPTVFICSVQGMRELLCEKSNLFLKDPTDLMTNMYGDTVVTTNGEEACLLRLSLTSLFTGSCLKSSNDYITSVCERCLKDLSLSGQPECAYSAFKRLGTELVLGLFLNVRAEEQPELYQDIVQLCTQHWHGLISAPVNVKVPLWSSGFSTALDAREKLMEIIKDKLENDKQGRRHASEQWKTPDYLRGVLLEVQRLWPPFIGGRRIADQDSTLAGFHVPKGYGAVYISHAIHRDPEVFHQPDDFLPERWSGRNAGQEHFLCSFGSGPRNCIGVKLTDVFLKEACMYLLKHYNWCLDPPVQDLDYKWLPVSRPAKTPIISFTRLDQTRSHRSNVG
ncbi:Cytochrome P450 3A4 [Larimichthys crocea]|uniref:Uncharacterized protein n=1 Tax=Larimichthys crocea TaxID=215358 RepID=A0ACD3QLK4_LARCR|nr:Cytochrome P450 3A4 [Larimichthys crocea]